MHLLGCGAKSLSGRTRTCPPETQWNTFGHRAVPGPSEAGGIEVENRSTRTQRLISCRRKACPERFMSPCGPIGEGRTGRTFAVANSSVGGCASCVADIDVGRWRVVHGDSIEIALRSQLYQSMETTFRG